MQPLYSNILVKQDSAESQSKGGIIIPEAHGEQPLTGVVKATGDGYVRENGSVRRLVVSVGDRVIFGMYSGTKVKLNGEEFLVMDEADVYGIL